MMRIISSTKAAAPAKAPAGRKRSPVRSGAKRSKVDSVAPIIAPLAAGAIGGMIASSDDGGDVCVEETFFAPEDVAQIVADQVSQAMGENIEVEVFENDEILSVVATDETGAEVAKTEIENIPDNVVTTAPTPTEIESSAKRSLGKGSAKKRSK
jgi:hypothetical protein